MRSRHLLFYFKHNLNASGSIEMKMDDIRAIARSHGVHAGRRSKTDLVRAIQSDEGNFDCYGTASLGECEQNECLWREDCFESSGKGGTS